MVKGTRTQASEMGKKGGQKGGPERARKLSRQERTNIARKGAEAKNAKYKK